VGGVAEQERAPDLESCRQPGAEGVGGAADDIQPVEVAPPGPRLQELTQRLGVNQVRLGFAVT
jgi:hypothetical protein